jgi:hypothetical protein
MKETASAPPRARATSPSSVPRLQPPPPFLPRFQPPPPFLPSCSAHEPHRKITHGQAGEEDSASASKGKSRSADVGPQVPTYPYPFFPRETTKFSQRFISHRFVSPIRLLVLGRTYGTFLHYERSYAKMFFYSGGPVPRPRRCLPPKNN